MDARINLYAPGAGAPLPELAARDDIIDRGAVALDRVHSRRARTLVSYGLRGIGKTVLLHKARSDAKGRGLASPASKRRRISLSRSLSPCAAYGPVPAAPHRRRRAGLTKARRPSQASSRR